MNPQPTDPRATPSSMPDFSNLANPGAAASPQQPQATAAPQPTTESQPTPQAQSGPTMGDVQSEFNQGQQELQEAEKMQNTPNQPIATPGYATGSHARLMNMVSGLAEGLSAFGKAIATHGKEGGAAEVAQLQQQQAAQQLAAQRQQQELKNEAVNQKVNMAHSHMAQMQYQIGLMKLPTELKEQALDLSNKVVDSFTKQYETGTAMGYDMDDPAQAAEARQRMGLDPAKEPGAVVVPFSAGQDTASTSQAVQQAVPPGKNLTDYAVFVSQNGTQHGQGGSVTLLPAQGQLMQMPATPRQIAATQAETESMIQQARAAGLSDDPKDPHYSPQFAQYEGAYNTVKNVIANGGKPTSLQIHNLHMATAGPLTTLVAGTAAATKMTSEREAAAAAGRPKDLESATSMWVAAGQTYRDSPTAANKKALDNAAEQRDAAYADKLAELREQAKIQAGAGGKGVEAMWNYGTNPLTKEKLSLDNAPDEFLVDVRTGNPIPIKSKENPTMQDTNRASFASSALHTLDSIDKLRAAGKLPNGPITGRTAEALAKLGLSNEDAQNAIDLISLGQSAATGAHVGGRFNIPIMDKMKGLLSLNMNDAQFSGAEDAIRNVLNQYVQTGGRYSVAQWKNLTPDERKAVQSGAGVGGGSSAGNGWAAKNNFGPGH